MKKGEVIIINTESYVISNRSVLGVELTHLDKDGNPIKGESMWQPRNKICGRIIDWTDKIVDFYEKYSILLKIIGVFVGFIDLAFFCQAVIPDFILILWGGSCLVIWFFELFSDWLIWLPIKISERNELRRKKKSSRSDAE